MMNLRLSNARKRKGLTQDELSALVHVSRQAYSLYEKGSRHPSLETVAAIAQILDVSSDYLLGLTDDPYPAITLDPHGREMLQTYQSLDERGRNMIDVTLKEQSRYLSDPDDGSSQPS